MTDKQLHKLRQKLEYFGLTGYAKRFCDVWLYMSLSRELTKDKNAVIDILFTDGKTDLDTELKLELIKEEILVKLFPDDVIPDDDSFENLVYLKKVYETNRLKRRAEFAPDMDFLIKVMSCPPGQIKETVSTIRLYMNCSEETVFTQYEKNLSQLLTDRSQVCELISYVTGIFGDDICKCVFWDALSLGVDETRERIEYLFKCTGKYAEKVIQKMYLPYHSQQFRCSDSSFLKSGSVKDAMRYLYEGYSAEHSTGDKNKWRPHPYCRIARTRELDCETIAHIFTSHPNYLSDYRPEYWWSLMDDSPWIPEMCHEVCRLVNVYEIQLDVADSLNGLRGNINKNNAEELWLNVFKPEYERINGMTDDYPYCPRLLRELICTVTAFSNCGITVQTELERYDAGESSMIIKRKYESVRDPIIDCEEFKEITDRKREAEILWEAVKERLRASLSHTAFELYFASLTVIGMSDTKIVLEIYSEVKKYIITEKFSTTIEALLIDITGKTIKFDIIKQSRE